MEPVRFDQMRRGCWDPDGPGGRHGPGRHLGVGQLPVSQITGFCGAVYSALLRPGARPGVRAGLERLVLRGVVLGPSRTGSCRWASPTWPTPSWPRPRSAATPTRGFVAVSLPEQPHRLGYPSLHSGWWDPVLAACVETGTVVCLHVGSSGMMDMAARRPAGRGGGHAVLVAVAAPRASTGCGRACALRFPDLRIAMSEGGIGWVPMLADRLDYIHDWSGHGRAGLAVDRADADRGAAAQLLVLLARRSVDLADPRPHRRRPHHGRGRLPPRRLDLARHPALPGRAAGRPAGRRAAPGPPRERGGAVPPSAPTRPDAPRRARRPDRTIT